MGARYLGRNVPGHRLGYEIYQEQVGYRVGNSIIFTTEINGIRDICRAKKKS